MDKRYDYDFEGIEKVAVKKFKTCVTLLAILSLVSILSVLAIIIWSEIIAVFILSVVLLVTSLTFISKACLMLSKISLKSTKGEIEHIHLDVKHVNQMKTANFSLQRAKYSNYWRSENRLTVFIREMEEIHSYQLNNIPKKLVDYYEEKGHCLHVKGTVYPIRIDTDETEWLCPICGTFNSNNSQSCSLCKNKIMK